MNTFTETLTRAREHLLPSDAAAFEAALPDFNRALKKLGLSIEVGIDGLGPRMRCTLEVIARQDGKPATISRYSDVTPHWPMTEQVKRELGVLLAHEVDEALYAAGLAPDPHAKDKP